MPGMAGKNQNPASESGRAGVAKRISAKLFKAKGDLSLRVLYCWEELPGSGTFEVLGLKARRVMLLLVTSHA
jgi:hypothetical protein